MPQNTPMKMQWITVDGRQTPIVLPQIWNHEKQDWEVTSDQNRLPVDARLTGSNVEQEVIQKSNMISKKDILSGELIPVGSFTLGTTMQVLGTRLSIGIRTVGREDSFEVRYQPLSSGTDLLSTRDNVPIKAESGYRGLGEVTNLSNECRIFVYNNGDEDIEIVGVTVFDFFN